MPMRLLWCIRHAASLPARPGPLLLGLGFFIANPRRLVALGIVVHLGFEPRLEGF